jgi:hypothetical protein
MQVNALYAAKIMAETGELEEGAPAKRSKTATQQSVLADDRFQGMFEDPAFTIDQGADDYKVLHPNAGGLSHPVHLSHLFCIMHNELSCSKAKVKYFNNSYYFNLYGCAFLTRVAAVHLVSWPLPSDADKAV